MGKKRGSRTYGYGRVGQHRGKGQKGGRGETGRRKHKWSSIVRYELDYFEKDGFKPPKRKDMHTINVGELADQVDQLRTERKAVKRRDGSHIDLEENGYHKLLGSGQISGPLIIGVVSHSGIALARIGNAKGRIPEAEGEEQRKR